MYYGKKVILRGLELSDLDSIMKNWNNLELRRTLSNQLPHSKEEELEWIKNTWKSRREGKGMQLAITDHQNNFLGTVGIFDIRNSDRRAEIGIAIHEIDNRGKGYGTDAVITMCAVGFNILNLHSIKLCYLDYNERSKAYYNAGFTEVGRHRDAIFALGKYRDLIYMDILEDEFRAKFPDYELFKK
jgi:RimJ/RimL family protein N-acetyltransferase